MTLQVNFSDALPFHRSRLDGAIISARGTIAEHLLITGMPTTQPGVRAEKALETLVQDGGLRMSACPTFVSVGQDLRPLSGFGIISTWIRHHRAKNQDSQKKQKTRNTVWKYVWESVDSSEKKLVEFDYKTGKAVDDLPDNLSDLDDEMSYDEDIELDSDYDSYFGDGYENDESPVGTHGGYDEPICANCNRD